MLWSACSSVSVPNVQVYTAEEKAALAMFNFEENKRKEQKILADLQSLVDRTLGEGEGEEGEEPPAETAPQQAATEA